MIAFGSSMTWPEGYERYAKSGIELAAEPDSEIYAIQAAGSIFRSYNLICERAAAHDDLEALVLVHQDAEIIDPDLCTKVREVLRDPDVGVIGAIGVVGVRSIAWWEASIVWGSAVYRYGAHGGGDVSALAWNSSEPPYVGTGEVEMVEGVLLVLSPWTVRNIKFDESLGDLYGFDFDLCMQLRAAGRKVVTADLRVAHHHSLDLLLHNEPWVAAHMRVARKWDGRMPGGEPLDSDWKRRARRAEAEAAAARLLVEGTERQADALSKHDERELEHVIESASWKLTAPLRYANARVRERRGEHGGPAAAAHP